MAIPELVKKAAVRQVVAFCEKRVPAEYGNEVRLEYVVRGTAITIVERRPPWHPGLPEWTTMKIAQLRYDVGSNTWSLYCCDRNERWFIYIDMEPSRDVAPLLAEIDADPTGTSGADVAPPPRLLRPSLPVGRGDTMAPRNLLAGATIKLPSPPAPGYDPSPPRPSQRASDGPFIRHARADRRGRRRRGDACSFRGDAST